MKKTRADIFVIGFALFSMFFGAGNVIFPPYLGLQAGPEWLAGFLCYYLADIGLALLALWALLRCGGTDGITRPLGRIPAAVLMSMIVLCIGPMLAIPRTAATTFEMSVLPLTEAINPAVFSAAFFLVILLMCLRESAVVDIVGKILTPALMIGLLVLIGKGVFDPAYTVALTPQADNVLALGVESGYQTMDVLAAMVFGILILESAQAKGYTESAARSRVVAGAGAVAGVGLLVVYLGLTYLGATVASGLDANFVSRSGLVVTIVNRLLGRAGVIIFAVVVALACMTTAVALVSSAAAFFHKLSNGRLSYRLIVVIICVFSALVSNVGLDAIVAIASPILNVVYPPALVLIVLSLFNKRLKNVCVYRLAVVGALVVSVLSAAAPYGLAIPLLDRLPLASLGFGWVVPAGVCGAVGLLFGGLRGGRRTVR